MIYEFTYPLERDNGVCLDLYVSGTYYPAVPESGPTFFSGGEPAEPAWFEIESVTLDKREIEITDSEADEIIEWVCENPPEEYDPEEWD